MNSLVPSLRIAKRRDAMRVLGAPAAVCALLIFLLTPRAQAQTVSDSIAQGLTSPEINVRHGAILELGKLPVSALSAAVRSSLIRLLESEGVGLKSLVPQVPDSGTATEEDETHAGYFATLASVVFTLSDASSLRGLSLVGLGIRRDTQEYVAANAAQTLPYLDEAYTMEYARHDAIVTWGLILSAGGPAISEADRQRVRQRLLTAASVDSLAFIWAVRRGALAELQPIVHAFAESGDEVLSSRAAMTDSALVAQLSTQSNAVQLRAARNWLEAFCAGATGARLGACQAVTNLLANATRQVEEGGGTPARNVFDALIIRVERARSAAVFTSAEAAILNEAARRVSARL